MDLKEWFASRKKQKEIEAVKPLAASEDICLLWKQCFQCREILYTSALRENQHVCPKCQYHFRIGAIDRIEQLFDAGTFHELDANLESADPLKFFDTDSYVKRQKEASRKSGLREAIITGEGNIEGEKACLGVMDFGHFGGSMGSVVGEKVTRLTEYATEKKLPLILVSSSGGARMQEGIFSLMQLAKTSSALKSFSDAGLLYISILSEPTYGGVTASFAMLGDINIAEPGARIGFAGRRVIEQTIRQKLPADFQTAEYLLKHGQVDMVVERGKLKSKLAYLIKFHSHSKSKAHTAPPRPKAATR
ncbi:MAG: acetyl-CoA carboxylase carboxyl transferase subunit beta [Cyanobacteria bacterium PR.3.49]|jgi:acetyl-CoA carboxylase carboxyl transferase subunit beta|nr:acetyl-CoA carboxylase carboxyl transferase subunit beta [Cyanobacteria bacterium PR.3.49]